MAERPPVRTETAPSEPSPDVSTSPNPPVMAGPLMVVGIGGSAGALDSYERLFLGLPPVSGMAFVVVPHLDPQAGGLMPSILQRCSAMPVVQIEDGMALLADRVYVIAPGFSLTLDAGVLHQRTRTSTDPLLIDHFLTSLALDQGEQAVAIVLSGTGSDGTQGLRAIEAHGGRVLVEDPNTAEYPEMPRSAASTNLADAVLPVEDIAARLLGFSARTRLLDAEELSELGGESGAPLQRILRLVRARTGHDFTRYKRATLVRRIDRRMKGQQITDVSVYLRRLENSPEEIEALFQDFTINVTSFFRDAEAFEALKAQLRTSLQDRMQGQDTFRVWVSACSTGEEAYSVAMVLRELTEELDAEHVVKVQIFATDIDQAAVAVARQARYPLDIAYVVSPERLARFFHVKDGKYQVRAEVRDLVVFAAHSTFGDPPFTRLDLLCCRNMLIYIGVELQQQLLGTFLYALRPGGLLFLGASETVGPRVSKLRGKSVSDGLQTWQILKNSGPDAFETPLSSLKLG
jgi:two-component system CheB/CheR fusion protein